MPGYKDYLALREEYNKVGGFPEFAEHCLKIRPKLGASIPFKLNSAQLHVYKELMKQYLDTGKIRAIILKGRQQGISTFVQAFFFEKLTYETGKKAFILSHETKTTKEVFDILKRFYEHLPSEFKPKVGSYSSSDLTFPDLDCSYSLGTAKNGSVGRGFTCQYVHASETAFWENDREILAGLMNSVPDVEETAIIIESTANGVTNKFYELWNNAVRGDSDFIPIFIPWYWQTEYRAKIKNPKTFSLTDEEKALKEIYNLDDKQIQWRRNKIASYDEDTFKQEYPFTASEAFLESNKDSFIKLEHVQKARFCNFEFVNNPSPLIIGVDPARGGDDTSICIRKGREVFPIERVKNKTLTEVVYRIKELIEEHNPERVFIDVGGLGYGVYEPLKNDGYDDIVYPVTFNSIAEESTKYSNKRAECWGRMRKWLMDEPCLIPDDEHLCSDLTSVTLKSVDSKSRLVLEDKENVKKRLGRSPDSGDSLALTFSIDDKYLRGVTTNRIWHELKKKKKQYSW